MTINLDQYTNTLNVTDTATNADLNVTTKGTGSHNLNTGNGTAFRVSDLSGTIVAGLGVFAGSSSQNSVYLVPYGSAGTANTVLASKGAGSVFFATNTNNNSTANNQVAVTHTASAVNYVQVTGAATGNSPAISAQGSDTNIQIQLQAKGTGLVRFTTGGGLQAYVSDTVSAVNQLSFTGSATGFGPRILSQGSDTNIPLVLQPKGTGALQAQQTDSTATGGNARGPYATDLQRSRSAASQVASGANSFIGSGNENFVTNSLAACVAGNANAVTGYSSFIGAGNSNTASNVYSSITTGVNNVASGFWTTVVNGNTNTAAGYYNFIGNGQSNSGTSGSAVTTQSATMNGTTAVTLSGSNASIKVGQYITGTSIAGDTYVFAISGTSLTLSKVASGSSTSTLSFYTPHGVVVGGGNNTATGSYSFIGGGGDAGAVYQRNVASGDWSTVVGGIDNVASGIASFVGGGGTYTGGFINGNTSSGDFSVTGGGLQNFSSGFGSVVLGGFLNSASTTYTSVVGGQQNSASNLYAFAGGGVANVANGIASTVVGGYYGITRGITGYQAFPACVQPVASASGVSQGGLLILGRQTTDATATRLTSDVNSAGIVNQIILPNNSAYFFTGEVVSGVTGGGNTKGWTIEGVIKRGANAASTALVGTPTVTSSYADAGASTWTIALSADTTNGGLAVTFTGQASTTIRTVCQVRTTEMTF